MIITQEEYEITLQILREKKYNPNFLKWITEKNLHIDLLFILIVNNFKFTEPFITYYKTVNIEYNTLYDDPEKDDEKTTLLLKSVSKKSDILLIKFLISKSNLLILDSNGLSILDHIFIEDEDNYRHETLTNDELKNLHNADYIIAEQILFSIEKKIPKIPLEKIPIKKWVLQDLTEKYTKESKYIFDIITLLNFFNK